MNYAGKASLFEGTTTHPLEVNGVKLQILAADQAGNFGQYILTFQK